MTHLPAPSNPYLLVGMLDSPFVRRIAITMEIYGIPYQNLPLRTVGDAEAFRAYSPLMRAPTLIVEDGEALFDSHLIVQHLDELVSPKNILQPSSPRERLLVRQCLGVAGGLADKAVSALYEVTFHPEASRSRQLLDRQKSQLLQSVTWLEERAPRSGCLLSSGISHADILVGSALRFAREAHPDFIDWNVAPNVLGWCERLEEMPEFEKTYLTVDPPQPSS